MLPTSPAMDLSSESHEKSEIISFFTGKNVFITGGTGFLGKVLLHKLLSTCPDIGTIFMLIRGKRGKTSSERLSELLHESPIFQNFVVNNPKIFAKVKAVDGDILVAGLGISQEQQEELIDKVNIIFNSAASVKFDDTAEAAIKMNVRGTEILANLAKKMARLNAFVHVSTAYSHCYRRKIDEVLYPTNPDHSKLLEDFSPWPNSYTMSKALAENTLANMKDELPLVIVRPSIVVAARTEPIPGWVDNMNGPVGMIVGFCTGFLRSIYLDKDSTMDLIPVDTVINLMCAVAYDASHRKRRKNNNSGDDEIVENEIPIFHCTSGSINPITWGGLLDHGFDKVLKYPYEKTQVLWYPAITFQTSRTMDVINRFFTNWVPAFLVDMGLYLTGRKPYLLKLTTRLVNGMSVLGYFAEREWKWSNSNSSELFRFMNKTDRKLFNFNISDMSWDEYLENLHLGIRRFLLKQNDSSFEASRRHIDRLRKLDLALKGFLFFLALACVLIFIDRLFY